MTSLDLVNPKFRNVLTFFQNGVQIAVQMCQIYKWSGASFVLGIFSQQKSQKNKRGLTSLHLATFLSEFYTCQNAAVLWSGVSTWIDTPLHLAALLSEFSYFDFFVAAKWSGIIPSLFLGFLQWKNKHVKAGLTPFHLAICQFDTFVLQFVLHFDM